MNRDYQIVLSTVYRHIIRISNSAPKFQHYNDLLAILEKAVINSKPLFLEILAGVQVSL